MRDRSVVASGRVFAPGEIVLADWRGDALPKEPNKLRPAVVVDFPSDDRYDWSKH